MILELFVLQFVSTLQHVAPSKLKFDKELKFLSNFIPNTIRISGEIRVCSKGLTPLSEVFI